MLDRGTENALINQLFSENAFIVLQKAMDAGALRQEVIASNAANINTPGFRKSRVEFEKQLRDVMESQAYKAGANSKNSFPLSNSLSSLSPKVVVSSGLASGDNSNNVDIDEEMASLAKNNIYYNTLSHLFSFKFRMLNAAINSGRG